MARRLRGREWSGVLDLHGSLRSRALSAAVPARRRILYDGRGFYRRLLVHAPRLASRLSRGAWRVTEAYCRAADRLLGEAGIPPARPLPAIHLGAAEKAWAMTELLRLGAGHGAVGLCPGARHKTKRWPAESYAALIDGLSFRQKAVPVFLSGSPEDRAIEEELRELVRRPETLRVVRQPIRRVAALLSRCRSVVTNDSGLMHVAAAVGTPVVALFGPTVSEFGFFPEGHSHQVLEKALSCRPCSLHGGDRCPEGHFRCLLEITPEDVLEALGRVSDPASRRQS
jgi:heptosyltransferase-2